MSLLIAPPALFTAAALVAVAVLVTVNVAAVILVLSLLERVSGGPATVVCIQKGNVNERVNIHHHVTTITYVIQEETDLATL